MNPSYYVQVPGTDFPTAEVEASSSKHARTAYLDYLSRNGQISWKDRQAWRPKIIAKRMQPGEIKTQVFLDYSARTIPEAEVSAPPTEQELVEEEQYYEAQPVEQVPAEMVLTTATPAPGVQPLTQPKVDTNKLSILGQVPSVLPRQMKFSPPKAMQISQRTGGV